MKKSLFNRAVTLAQRSAVKPDAVVVAAKPEAMSCRLYTRITPSEMRRLEACVGKMMPVSGLLRDLLLQYLDKKDDERKTKKK